MIYQIKRTHPLNPKKLGSSHQVLGRGGWSVKNNSYEKFRSPPVMTKVQALFETPLKEIPKNIVIS